MSKAMHHLTPPKLASSKNVLLEIYLDMRLFYSEWSSSVLDQSKFSELAAKEKGFARLVATAEQLLIPWPNVG